MKKYLSHFTGSFQYVAGAMMIPIIVLVVCGLLMGFASAICQLYIHRRYYSAYDCADVYENRKYDNGKPSFMVCRRDILWFIKK